MIHRPTRSLLRGIALVATLTGGLPVSAAVDPADVVAEPDEVITFERHCATEQPYRVQAYGRFATAEPATAEALVLVLAGHAGPLRDSPVIGVGLQAMRIRGLVGWADEPFSMALVVADGSNAVVGASVATYYESAPGGPPGATAFRMDSTGNYDWLSFVEPGEAPADETGQKSHRIPPDLYVSHTHFADSDWNEPMRLSLVLESEGQGEQVTLVGPHLIAPRDIMNAPAPEGRVLGLLETLNPLDEGGLFQWLRGAVKYRKCIDERRAAKRAFARRASVTPSARLAVAP